MMKWSVAVAVGLLLAGLGYLWYLYRPYNRELGDLTVEFLEDDRVLLRVTSDGREIMNLRGERDRNWRNESLTPEYDAFKTQRKYDLDGPENRPCAVYLWFHNLDRDGIRPGDYPLHVIGTPGAQTKTRFIGFHLGCDDELERLRTNREPEPKRREFFVPGGSLEVRGVNGSGIIGELRGKLYYHSDIGP